MTFTPKRHERGQWIRPLDMKEIGAMVVCYAVVWMPLVMLGFVLSLNDTQWSCIAAALNISGVRG